MLHMPSHWGWEAVIIAKAQLIAGTLNNKTIDCVPYGDLGWIQEQNDIFNVFTAHFRTSVTATCAQNIYTQTTFIKTTTSIQHLPDIRCKKSFVFVRKPAQSASGRRHIGFVIEPVSRPSREARCWPML